MRSPVSISAFVCSFALMTSVCTWGWDRFVSGTLYVCTDSVPLGFLQPGDWIHGPVTVDRIVPARSMSEPDTIRSGWTIGRLWMLWCFLSGLCVMISLLVARLPFE